MSDTDNLEKVTDHTRDRLRFVQDEKAWYVCNDNNVWSLEDRSGSIGMVLSDLVAAGESPNLHHITAVLGLLKSELRARPNDFDANPYMLATPTQLIDLKHYSARDIEPSDLVTRTTAVDLDEADFVAYSAERKLFERRVLEICGGDADLVGFLQRAAGYTLLGDQKEECLFVLAGPTRTGKSTLLDAMHAALGSYASSVKPQFFLDVDDATSRYTGARLKGVRLVTTTEPPAGKAFDGSLVKQMVSDELEARHPGLRAFVYRPQFTVWMAANEVPRIKGDRAILRRLHIIPLTKQFEPDPNVKLWARSEVAGTGCLQWMLAGLARYLREGLGTCSAVESTVADYAAADDDIGRFLAEETEWKTDGKVTTRLLYERYTAWCKSEGIAPLAANRLGTLLGPCGVTRGQSGSQRYYGGIILRTHSIIDEVRARGMM